MYIWNLFIFVVLWRLAFDAKAPIIQENAADINIDCTGIAAHRTINKIKNF